MNPPVSTRAVSSTRQIGSALVRLCRERDFAIALACCVTLGLAGSFVLPFFSLFGTQEVKMSLRGFGAFQTASAIAGIAISTFLSHRSDSRYSRRSLLQLSSACGAVGYLGYAFTREVWALLAIAVFLLGIASLTFSQLFAHARELVAKSELPARDAPLYVNVFRMSFALAWTVGPALAAATLRATSFTGLFLTASALYLVFFAIVCAGVRTEERALPATRASELGIRALLAAPGVFGWFVCFVLIFSATTMSMSNMSLYVLKELGGTDGNVGTIFSLAPVFELPFMLYFGLLATRIGSTALIRAAFVLALVYFSGLASVRAPWQIYPLQALSAAIVAVTGGIAITFFQNKLPGQLGAATNLYSNAQRVGTTSGYLAFGAVASRFGHRGTYVACALLAALAFGLSSVLGRSTARVSET